MKIQLAICLTLNLDSHAVSQARDKVLSLKKSTRKDTVAIIEEVC